MADLSCSFCSKAQGQVRKLVAGPGVFICDECVELVQEIIRIDLAAPVPVDGPSDASVAESLTASLRGEGVQAAALSMARILGRHLRGERPGHVLLVGPTGSGKSALVGAMRKALSVPVAVVDVSHVTETGYFGINPAECLATLVKAADYDVMRAQRGVLVLDHLDHVDSKGDPRLSVQRELLGHLEGAVVEIHHGRHRGEGIAIDTSGILFVGCGSFGACDGSLDALRRWGLVEPLLARFPHRIALQPPTVDDLTAIVGSMRMDLSYECARAVAEEAARLGLGAWGLRHVLAGLDVEDAEEIDVDLVRRVASRL